MYKNYRVYKRQMRTTDAVIFMIFLANSEQGNSLYTCS
jgi:hypothetical protein